MSETALRGDLRLIADMIASGSRVLDVGIGDGALLKHLVRAKGVDGRGIELSPSGVAAGVAQGLSVIQGDADTDLEAYPDLAFDYVVLSQTLPAVRRPREVLLELLRIGRRAIVSIPNFGHWRVRLALLFGGRMPMTPIFDRPWHETPIIHPCTIADFLGLCDDLSIRVERGVAMRQSGAADAFLAHDPWVNLFSEQAVFLLARN
ncbi:MAG: methionine biosynthesis protein MetW [Alphaproteobacteria bacterium]|nr:methionine biosynthesis protein MetW [Alphaproteobacteria bacterium]